MLTLIVKMELLRFRDADLIDLFLSRDDDFLTYAIRQISQKGRKKKRIKKKTKRKSMKKMLNFRSHRDLNSGYWIQSPMS